MILEPEIPLWIVKALEDLQAGVKQGSPRILDYFKAVNYPNPTPFTPSCAAAVNYWLQEAGKKGNGSAAASAMKTYGTATKPRMGAIGVFLWPSGPDAGGHHTAFLLELDVLHPGMGIFLGSNQHHQVCLISFPMQDLIALRFPV